MRLFSGNKEYKQYVYNSEEEFEQDVILNSKKLFGEKTIYIDVKKKLKGKFGEGTIPDGYLFDYTFTDKPKLYFVESERIIHGVREHIVPQLLKFKLSYKNNMMLLKNILIEKIEEQGIKIDEIAKSYNYRNSDDMFSDIISKDDLNIIVPIDEVTEELIECVSYLNLKIELREFKKFVCGDSSLFLFEPLNEEIEEVAKTLNIKNGELDTIIVAAQDEGFEKEFIGNSCWFPVSIGIGMLDKLKYIVSYRKAPIKALTHYAEISNIELYKDTGKYIIYFKDKPKKLARQIPLNDANPNHAPQPRVYTSFEKIVEANEKTTLDDLY